MKLLISFFFTALAYSYIGFFSFSALGQNKLIKDSLIQILNNEKNLNDTLIYNIYIDLAYNSSTPNGNIYYANKAWEIANRVKNNKWLAACNMYLGDGFRLQGKLPIAISHYLDAANLYESVYSKIGLASAYINLGAVYMDQENFRNSKFYYLNAIEIFRNASDSLLLATTLTNVGELYRKNVKLDSANVFFKESTSIFEIQRHQIGIAYNLGNMGLVYAEQGKYDLAEKNMQEAIVKLNKLGDRYPIAAYETSLAEIYAKRGNLKMAFKYAYSALNIGQEEGLKEQIRDASLKLSEIYQKTGDFKKAYNYQSQYIAYRDSINNEDVIRKMADLRTEYEVGQKQTELDLKQVEVDLLNSQSRIDRIIMIAALIGFVLVVILAYVLLKLYRLRERAIRISKERRRIIAQQRNKLEALNLTKDKFFSLISHDIRGPVNNFHGVAQLIKIYVESGEISELMRVSRLLDKSSTELSTLLDNLLDWAMSQQGKFPYKPVKLSLSSVCNSNLIMMSNMASAKGIAMTEEIISEIEVMADRNSVSTIIRNLLSNALKFTEQGGEITINISSNETEAIVTISDTGIGIPRDKMETLFGFKGERSRWGTAGEKGIGLGLNLVYEFVELNKGRIEVESDEGVGTDFRVFLPLALS